MTDSISFFCAGEPQPKGSTRAFVVKGRPIITSSNKNLKTWELRIAHEAQAVVPEGFCDSTSAYSVTVRFLFTEPKGHAKSFEYHHTTRPDADKLLRSCLDALTKICWNDDAQVHFVDVGKEYSKERLGVEVIVQKRPGRFKR